MWAANHIHTQHTPIAIPQGSLIFVSVLSHHLTSSCETCTPVDLAALMTNMNACHLTAFAYENRTHAIGQFAADAAASVQLSPTYVNCCRIPVVDSLHNV